MPRVLTVIALMLFAMPLRAQEQSVRIPDGCKQLAERNGLPLELTPTQAALALAYLRLMDIRVPAVRRCREAMLNR
jgi:hypothetical protein